MLGALVSAAAVLVIACGGDPVVPASRFDSGSHIAPSPPGPTPTVRPATEPEYARALCVGLGRFFRDFDSATRAINPHDAPAIPGHVANALGGTLHQFASHMAAMRPPAYFETWHVQSVDGLLALATEIRSGKPLNEILRVSEEPLPRPPTELAVRLAAAAAGVSECAPYDALLAPG